MPPVTVSQADLALFGQRWSALGQRLGPSQPHSSAQLCELFDRAVGEALARMLGDIPVVKSRRDTLMPPDANCVEVGPILVIGGVRPQRFDVGYRPDGVRFVLDTKTLNDTESIKKNWQNMINDLGTEAATVHSRFPHAVVTFMVILPRPCLMEPQQSAIIETLRRLAARSSVREPDYMAEAIALVVWNPADGRIDPTIPHSSSALRIEKFSDQIEPVYSNRYQGFAPHAL